MPLGKAGIRLISATCSAVSGSFSVSAFSRAVYARLAARFGHTAQFPPQLQNRQALVRQLHRRVFGSELPNSARSSTPSLTVLAETDVSQEGLEYKAIP